MDNIQILPVDCWLNSFDEFERKGRYEKYGDKVFSKDITKEALDLIAIGDFVYLNKERCGQVVATSANWIVFIRNSIYFPFMIVYKNDVSYGGKVFVMGYIDYSHEPNYRGADFKALLNKLINGSVTVYYTTVEMLYRFKVLKPLPQKQESADLLTLLDNPAINDAIAAANTRVAQAGKYVDKWCDHCALDDHITLFSRALVEIGKRIDSARNKEDANGDQ